MQPTPDLIAMVTAVSLFFFLFPFVLMGTMCMVGALLFAFWIWMIVDCATNEPPGNDKIVWILIVVLLNWVGAIVYFFARRRNRAKGQFFKPEPPPPIR
jgi:hypothetical protein